MYEGAVQDLIDELGRLPGVGPKSAQRIAFHLLSAESTDVGRLVSALTRVQAEVRFCVTCYNVAEGEQCRICRDPRRSDDVLCVVEEPRTSSPSSARVSSAVATTCSAVPSARSTAWAPTTCGSRSS